MRAIFRPAEDESMDKIIIRPMTPEDWGAVSRIYVEGIATEYATFQTECPPYTAWDASHTKECRSGHSFRRGAGRVVCLAPGRPPLVLPGRGRGEYLCG